MEIRTCGINAADVIEALETETILTLATCADNRVTIRPMSHINDGLTVFFQTGKDYLKIEQIQKNPFVAMCVGTYEMEGRADLIGHPMDEKNQFFIEKFRPKHPNAFKRWSACDDEIVVRVKIQRVRQWRYIDGDPVLAESDFTDKEE